MQDVGIGAWLKRRRAELSLTQQQLGQRVGASVITIRKLEAGARRPSAEMARALLHALAVPKTEREAFLALAAAAADERHEHHPDNWPRHFTPLVGRERELARAIDVLLRNDVRLLTVLGPGGIGKTRFGLAVAEHVADQFVDGLFFIDLAPIHDAAQVLDAMCQTLAAPRSVALSAQDALRRTLKDKYALLVLDNFEQVIGAAPELGELLLTCPRLKAIVTSRSVLRIGLEQRFVLASLTLPSAIDLFAQRAQAADDRFALDEANAEAVQHICQLLEGMPLSIELVAARVSLMSPRALLLRLTTGKGKVRLDLVADGLSDLPARQKTLQHTLQWSYDLLDVDEQATFRRLSVFADGFSLGSAEALLQDEPRDVVSIWNTLTSLADKSLIHKRDDGRDDGSDARLFLLETVRVFAAEKLAQQPGDEERNYRVRHLSVFLGLAETAAQHWRSHHEKEWVAVLQREQADIYAALEFALSTSDAAASIRCCSALWRFWMLRGQLYVGRSYLLQALALATQAADAATADLDSARANCLRGLGTLCERQGDYAEAETHWRESLRIYQALGDRVNEAAMRSNLGIIAIDKRDFARAQHIFVESAAFCQREGLQTGLASAYSNLGFVASAQAEHARVIAYFNDAIDLWRVLGSKTDLAGSLAELGYPQARLDDDAAARASFVECLALCQELDDVLTILTALPGMTLLASKHGQAELAVQLHAATERHSLAVGTQESPASRLDEATWKHMRTQLGEPAFDEHWQRGRALSLDEAIALAVGLKLS